jgi:hypothetical protein
MVGVYYKVSPFYGVSKAFNRRIHGEKLAVVCAVFLLRGDQEFSNES